MIADSQCSKAEPKKAASKYASNDVPEGKQTLPTKDPSKGANSPCKPQNVFEKALVLTQSKMKKSSSNIGDGFDLSPAVTKPSGAKPHFSSPFLQRKPSDISASDVVKDKTASVLNTTTKNETKTDKKPLSSAVSSCFYDDINFDDNSDFAEHFTSDTSVGNLDQDSLRDLHPDSQKTQSVTLSSLTAAMGKGKTGLSNISGIKPYDPANEKKKSDTEDRGVKRKRLGVAECGRRQSDADIENELGGDVGWCPDPRVGYPLDCLDSLYSC